MWMAPNSNDLGVVLHAHLSTSCLPNKWYVCMYLLFYWLFHKVLQLGFIIKDFTFHQNILIN